METNTLGPGTLQERKGLLLVPVNLIGVSNFCVTVKFPLEPATYWTPIVEVLVIPTDTSPCAEATVTSVRKKV
jgi:hypothetical protein